MTKNRKKEALRPQRAKRPLKQLKERPELFQPRGHGLTNRHVEDLVDVLRNGGELDPIKAWRDPDSKDLVIVDGHHRAAAHRRVKGAEVAVPVLIYECDREAAYLLSMADNGKRRLEVLFQDCQNRAWFLTCYTSHSKTAVALNTGIGTTQVSRMRRVKKQLMDGDTVSVDNLPKTWADARMKANNTYNGTHDWDAEELEMRREETLRKQDEKFGKDLAWYFQHDPDKAWELVKRCAGKNALGKALDSDGWVNVTFDQMSADEVASSLSEVFMADDIDEIASKAKELSSLY